MKKETPKKYIFVVGGVMSSVGKGVASSSIAKVLQARGYSVTCIKADPYINVDAGTMNPIEHGEVFVTDDGYETDLDGGNYERFLDTNLCSANYMTTGLVYKSVIDRERALGYGGKCVEVIPHIPDEIISRIHNAAKVSAADIAVIEIGGTVGEYQNQLFLEASRLMKLREPENIMTVMVSYMPTHGKYGEMKTKPTQFASRTLNAVGIQADIIIARSTEPLDEKRRKKLSVFCNVPTQNIISTPDVDLIYNVPLNFVADNLDNRIIEILGLEERNPRNGELAEWDGFFKKVVGMTEPVRVAVVGKYFESGDFILGDVYISVLEAIKHASWSIGKKPVITYIPSQKFEKKEMCSALLDDIDAIVVPGGFGDRDVDGIINATEYSRKKGIPFLGICYGMQLACIEFAKNVLEIRDANTQEINPDGQNLIIRTMESQHIHISEQKYGGTMRLGAYPCVIKGGSLTEKLYKKTNTTERHRHRFEFNNEYRKVFQDAGMIFAGLSPDQELVEIVELRDHPFFIGCQFHPEFLSRPMSPSPLFRGLLEAANERIKKSVLLS